MEHAAPLPFLRETLLFLALAGLLIPLLQRLKINQVLGFLFIGVVVGPHGVGSQVDHWPWLAHLTFQTPSDVQSLAELGVVFLMFLVGLELSIERLKAMWRWVLGAGSVQVLASAAVIGGFAYAFGNPGEMSVLLGLVLSLSSTAVVMQLLSERHLMATRTGQAVFGVLMMQDFAVVPLLILVDLLGSPDRANFASVIALTLLKSASAVALIFLAGRRMVAPVFRTFAQQRQPEIFVALTLLFTLGIAGLTAAVGLSLALGAFLAGLLLAETEFRHEIEITLEPFKALLMGLFFMSVGMGIDLEEVARKPGWLLASVLGLMAIKATVAALTLRAFGLYWGRALDGGILLSQGGEFAFVIVGYAVAYTLLPGEVGQFMMLVVSLSLMLTPVLSRFGHQLALRLDAQRLARPGGDQPEIPADLSGHLVIAGFGRVGQLLGEILAREGVGYVAIEHDAQVVAAQRRLGRPVVFGNEARPDLLRKLNVPRAAALVITVDRPAAAMRALRAARHDHPSLPILVRSRDEHHAAELVAAGASAVIPETLEAGLQLATIALRAAGLVEHQIEQAVARERERRLHHAGG